MQVKEFINHYLKIGGVDYDGHYGKQCVDLFRAYHRDVIGHKRQPKAVRGAKDFWGHYTTDNELKSNYKRIPNTPDFIPREGDVMVWKHGTFGHIAICTGEATKNWFKSLDQNWYGKRKINIIKHSYSNVYGVFRPYILEKEYEMKCSEFVKSDISAECEKALNLKKYDWYDKHWNWEQFVDFTNQKVKATKNCQKELESAKKLITEQEEKIKNLRNELNTMEAEKNGWKHSYEEVSKENVAMENKIAKLSATLADCREENAGITKENKRLSGELVNCYKESKECKKKLENCMNGHDICSYTVGEMIKGIFSCLKK